MTQLDEEIYKLIISPTVSTTSSSEKPITLHPLTKLESEKIEKHVTFNINIKGFDFNCYSGDLGPALGAQFAPTTQLFRQVINEYFGHQYKINYSTLTQINLPIENIDIFLLTSLLKNSLTEKELTFLKNFVENGGTLFFHAHSGDDNLQNNSQKVLDLFKETVEITALKNFSSGEIFTVNNLSLLDSRIHPLINGHFGSVKSFYNQYCTILKVRNTSYILCNENNNNPIDAILVAFPHKLGLVVLFTNWHAFMNMRADNKILIGNIIQTIIQKKRV